MGSVQSFETPKRWGGRPGKIDAPLNKKLSEVKWGDFRIGDLFEVRPTKSYGLTNTKLFATAGDTPVVTNTGANNGVSGRVALPPTEKGGIITYSDTTTSDAIFYQSEDFIGYSHVQGLYPKQTVWNRFRLLYFVAAFKKAAANKFDYGNKFNRAITTEMYVTLPVTINSEIDFEFIDNFIVELEAQRIVELEAYLTVAGLKDYDLNEKEELALDSFDKIVWNKFKIGDLLEKAELGIKNKTFNKKTDLSTIQDEVHPIPVTNAKFGDNGIMFWARKDDFETISMAIDIIQNGAIATGKVYPQPQETGVLWDSYLLTLKEFLPTKEILFFLTTAIEKSIREKYSYEYKAYWSKVQDEYIMLPSQNGIPDYDCMATLISAIQKEVIKDVVFFANRKIEAAKEIVNK